VTAHASVYTLVLMSLDRYLAVVHPITSMTIRNVRNTSIVLAVAWLIIVVANAPMLLEFQVYQFIIIISPRVFVKMRRSFDATTTPTE